MAGHLGADDRMYESWKLCPDLRPKQICFVLERYENGQTNRIVHQHVPGHRISNENRLALLRALVIAGDRRTDDELASILGFFLNSRGREPSERSMRVQCKYPEPGVLRTYCGTDLLAWSDQVVAPDAFRPMAVLRKPRELANQLPALYFSDMDDLNISLPSSQQAYVEDQVASGQYPSVSEYVSELIRADQKAKAQEKLEALLLEGLDSGPGRQWTEDDWEKLRKRTQKG